MPAPRELPQQIHVPGQKLNTKCPWWGQIFGGDPRGCAGRMVIDETDDLFLLHLLHLARFECHGLYCSRAVRISIFVIPIVLKHFNCLKVVALGLPLSNLNISLLCSQPVLITIKVPSAGVLYPLEGCQHFPDTMCWTLNIELCFNFAFLSLQLLFCALTR